MNNKRIFLKFCETFSKKFKPELQKKYFFSIKRKCLKFGHPIYYKESHWLEKQLRFFGRDRKPPKDKTLIIYIKKIIKNPMDQIKKVSKVINLRFY